jgi:hypothetical protein
VSVPLEQRRRQRVRDTTDWPRLYDEGLRVEMPGDLPEGSALLPRHLITLARGLVARAEQLAPLFAGLVRVVMRGRIV